MVLEPPKENHKYFGVRLKCVTCKTGRTYKIDTSVNSILKRETSGITVEAECDTCGTVIGFEFGLLDDAPGYASRAVNEFMEEGLEISDDGGLPSTKRFEPVDDNSRVAES